MMKTILKTLDKHIDERGLLTEIIRDDEIKENIKQIYFSISKPNAIRGNHYHERKVEWFAVVKGEGKLILKDNQSEETNEIILNSNEPNIVKINPYVSHALKNISDEEMYLIVIADEVFNPEDADTFPAELIR